MLFTKMLKMSTAICHPLIVIAVKIAVRAAEPHGKYYSRVKLVYLLKQTKNTGFPNNSNNGSVLFKCPSNL